MGAGVRRRGFAIWFLRIYILVWAEGFHRFGTGEQVPICRKIDVWEEVSQLYMYWCWRRGQF